MCGLLAEYNPAGVDAAVLARARSRLAHRGPDGVGLWLSTDGQTGLAHTRLAIMDPAGSPQPIVSEDGLSALIVNGEFYDHQAIRADLLARGHRFSTQGDSEIALHLYQEYGLDFLAHLRGEFALVLWDGRARRLIAARDRWGIKPLCVHHDGQRLRLASEAKALFALGVHPRWDDASLWQVAGMQYALPERTLFAGVRQLRPGHYLVADASGVRESVYWDISYPNCDEKSSREETPGRIREALAEAVRLRLRADVPVCFHLSGGLDSASVVALGARELANRPVCFSVGFEAAGYDERQQAAQTADALGVELRLVEASRASMLDDLADAVYFSEGLAINGHLPAKYALARAIARDGFRVVLSGEGADEVFGGYAHQRADSSLNGGEDQRRLGALHQASAIVAGIHLPEGEGLSVEAVQRRLRFVPSFLRAKATLGLRMRGVLRPEFIARFRDVDPFEAFLGCFDVEGQLRGRHPVDQSTYLWSKSALATYILRTLGDGTEMAHGVEGRLPMLDQRLFDRAREVRLNQKIDASNGKLILRQAMRGLLPETVCQREKQPFTAPPLSLDARGEPEARIRDEFRSGRFAGQPFFAPEKLIAQLEQMPQLSDRERVAMDPVIMVAYTASLVQARFGL